MDKLLHLSGNVNFDHHMMRYLDELFEGGVCFEEFSDEMLALEQTRGVRVERIPQRRLSGNR